MSKIVVKDLVAAYNSDWNSDCLKLIVAELNYLK